MSSPIFTFTGPAALITAGSGFGFSREITDLRGSPTSLEAFTTVGLDLDTLLVATIGGQSQFWQLLSGAADATDPNNQVAPLDYNASTNNVHWQNTGTFKEGLLAVEVTRSGAQGIPSGSDTPISFTTSRTNTGEWTLANPTRFTVDTPGVYLLNGRVTYAANTVGNRNLYLRKNGGNYVANNTKPANQNGSTPCEVNAAVALVTGDYIELVANQTSGSSLDAQKIADYTPEFSAVWLGNLVAMAKTPISITGGGTDDDTGLSDKITVPFQTTAVGWYRVYQGVIPAVGGFSLRRLATSDTGASDSDIQFGVFGGSAIGTIQVVRNTMNPSLQTFDTVMVSYQGSVSYVDVHLNLAGSWEIEHADVTGYVPPFEVTMPGSGGNVSYNVRPNVTGTTGSVDAQQITSNGVQFGQKGVAGWGTPTGTLDRTVLTIASGTLSDALKHLGAMITDHLAFGSIRAAMASSMTYTTMLQLADNTVSEGTSVSLSDSFKITVAPDTTVQGTWVPDGTTVNSKAQYRLEGSKWNTATTTCINYSGSVWRIYNASGLLYNSSAPASPANPWSVTQWQNLVPANVTVTIPATPNGAPPLNQTFNVITDIHTAVFVIDSNNAANNGTYSFVDTHNGRRRYYQLNGPLNRRIEWTGTIWTLVDDTPSTYYTSTEVVTYPDQVNTWLGSSINGVLSVRRIDGVDLDSGCTVTGGGADTDGVYVPQIGVNTLGGQCWMRIDGLRFFNYTDTWQITDGPGTYVTVYAESDTSKNRFPWSASWISDAIIVQEKAVAGYQNWHV